MTPEPPLSHGHCDTDEDRGDEHRDGRCVGWKDRDPMVARLEEGQQAHRDRGQHSDVANQMASHSSGYVCACHPAMEHESMMR